MFERFREARDEVGELNLIPVMNLMVTLIPFLMLGAAFYHIGVIPAAIPTKVDQLAEAPKDDILVLNIEIEAEAITVSASSATVDAETLAALAFSLPRLEGGHDTAALTERLSVLKARYPKSKTAVLMPVETVRYAELVAVIDAAREKVVTGPEGPQITTLFPETVFSKRPPPEPDAGVEAPPEAPATEAAP